MQICTFIQTDNHASIPPLSFLQAGCPSWHQTSSVKAHKTTVINVQLQKNVHSLQQLQKCPLGYIVRSATAASSAGGAAVVHAVAESWYGGVRVHLRQFCSLTWLLCQHGWTSSYSAFIWSTTDLDCSTDCRSAICRLESDVESECCRQCTCTSDESPRWDFVCHRQVSQFPPTWILKSVGFSIMARCTALSMFGTTSTNFTHPLTRYPLSLSRMSTSFSSSTLSHLDVPMLNVCFSLTGSFAIILITSMSVVVVVVVVAVVLSVIANALNTSPFIGNKMMIWPV